jgi:hypothetical protein
MESVMTRIPFTDIPQAKLWFTDAYEFRQLCGDAQSKARSEKAMDFTRDMMLKANKHGLDTYITYPQLEWLCQIADKMIPRRIQKDNDSIPRDYL